MGLRPWKPQIPVLLDDRSGNGVICHCSSSTLRFDVFCMPRYLSAHHGCKEQLFKKLYLSWQLKPNLTLSLAILFWHFSSARRFHSQTCHSLIVFFFFAPFLENAVCKNSQEISCFKKKRSNQLFWYQQPCQDHTFFLLILQKINIKAPTFAAQTHEDIFF